MSKKCLPVNFIMTICAQGGWQYPNLKFICQEKDPCHFTFDTILTIRALLAPRDTLFFLHYFCSRSRAG